MMTNTCAMPPWCTNSPDITKSDINYATTAWKKIVNNSSLEYMSRRDIPGFPPSCLRWFYDCYFTIMFTHKANSLDVYEKNVILQRRTLISLVTKIIEMYHQPKNTRRLNIKEMITTYKRLELSSCQYIKIIEAILKTFKICLNIEFNTYTNIAFIKIFSSLLNKIIPTMIKAERWQRFNDFIYTSFSRMIPSLKNTFQFHYYPSKNLEKRHSSVFNYDDNDFEDNQHSNLFAVLARGSIRGSFALFAKSRNNSITQSINDGYNNTNNNNYNTSNALFFTYPSAVRRRSSISPTDTSENNNNSTTIIRGSLFRSRTYDTNNIEKNIIPTENNSNNYNNNSNNVSNVSNRIRNNSFFTEISVPSQRRTSFLNSARIAANTSEKGSNNSSSCKKYNNSSTSIHHHLLNFPSVLLNDNLPSIIKTALQTEPISEVGTKYNNSQQLTKNVHDNVVINGNSTTGTTALSHTDLRYNRYFGNA